MPAAIFCSQLLQFLCAIKGYAMKKQQTVYAGNHGGAQSIRRFTKRAGYEKSLQPVGINFKNIIQNEDRIIRTLKEYTKAGRKIEQATSLSPSPNDSGSGGIL
jgi:hypothetical protein